MRHKGWVMATESVPRLELLLPEHLSAEQRGLYRRLLDDAGGNDSHLLAGDGSLLGPFNAVITVPDVGECLRSLARQLQSGERVPAHLYETAILTSGAVWQAEYMLAVHKQRGMQVGLSLEVVEQLVDPTIGDVDAPGDVRTVWQFCHELTVTRSVSDSTYRQMVALVGTEGTVVVTILVGHYALIGGLLRAFRVPGLGSREG